MCNISLTKLHLQTAFLPLLPTELQTQSEKVKERLQGHKVMAASTENSTLKAFLNISGNLQAGRPG